MNTKGVQILHKIYTFHKKFISYNHMPLKNIIAFLITKHGVPLNRFPLEQFLVIELLDKNTQSFNQLLTLAT